MFPLDDVIMWRQTRKPFHVVVDDKIVVSFVILVSDVFDTKQWLRPYICLRIPDDVIIWEHFPRDWPFVRGIHRSPVNPPHKGQWRGALMFSLNCVWINGWVNGHEAGDLRRYRAHYDVMVMLQCNIGVVRWLRHTDGQRCGHGSYVL